MPGWDLAASVYATGDRSGGNGDWLEEAKARAAAGGHTPALAFEKQAADSPRLLVANKTDELPRGGPTFAGSDPVAPPVAPPKGDPMQGLPPGVRIPMWTPEDTAPLTRPDAVIPWRKLFTFIVLVVLAAGAYKAYPSAHAWFVARSVPSDLRAYVRGKGVRYAPEGQGFEARLPKAPTHGDAPLGVQPAPWTAIHRAVVSGADYHIVIRVGELTGGAPLPFGLGGVLADPRIGGEPTPHNLQLVTFGDKPAYAFHVDGPRPIAGRVFRRGNLVYVVSVQSKGAGHVLDTVLHSFKLDGE